MICFKPITNRKGETYVVELDYADAWLFDKYRYYIKKGSSGKGDPYCARSISSRHPDGRQYTKTVFLHMDIVGNNYLSEKLVCDHINRDTLDNRRSNLRTVCFSTNSLNSKRSNGFSSFRLTYVPRKNFYQVYYKKKYLGGSTNYEKARLIRDTYFKNITTGAEETEKKEQIPCEENAS